MRRLDKLFMAGRLAAVNPSMATRYFRYRVRRALPGWAVNGKAAVRFGDITFMIDSHMAGNLVAAQMARGFYQMPVIAAMRRHLRPGDSFFDVGANVGYMTAFGAHLVGVTGKVVAFEPVPDFVASLEVFRQVHLRYQIIILPVAASDRDGTAPMDFASWTRPGGSTLAGLLPSSDVRERVSVSTLRLDRYIADTGIRPTLIKIDVEGHEWAVLRGLETYLASARPFIICEVSPETGHAPLIANWMADLGYSACDLVGGRPIRLGAQLATDVIFKPITHG